MAMAKLTIYFPAMGNVTHQEFFSLRSSVKKIFNGREDWQLRVSAIVRSIMSSLKWALCIRPNNTAFCSALGNALNAVRKTSALACVAVIGEPPLQDKFTTRPTMCQGENGENWENKVVTIFFRNLFHMQPRICLEADCGENYLDSVRNCIKDRD